MFSTIDRIILSINEPAIDSAYASKFTPYQRIVYLTTQALLAEYFSSMHNCLNNDTSQFHLYTKNIVQEFYKLPHSEYMPGKYIVACELFEKLFIGSDNRLQQGDLGTILSLYMDSEILDCEYISKLPKEFLIPFLYARNGLMLTDNDIIDDSIINNTIMEPCVYAPEFLSSESSNMTGPAMTNTHVGGLTVFCSRLERASYVLEGWDQDPFTYFNLSYRYIAGLNWSGKTLSDLVGFLSLYAVEHDFEYNTCSIADICYDIVTQSNFTTDCTVISSDMEFVKLIKYLCDRWSLAIDDNELLATILERCNCNIEVLSYLTKSIEAITTFEMESFNNSILSKFVNKRILLEASDLDSSMTENLPDTELPTNNEDNDMSDTAIPDMNDSSIGGETQDDNSNSLDSIDRAIPESVDGIVLELLDPSKETLSDYLYRAEFQMRVKNLVQNPGDTKCSKYTMYLLTQWATKWLYVCSVNSLKSFLENISFPIMSEQLN